MDFSPYANNHRRNSSLANGNVMYSAFPTSTQDDFGATHPNGRNQLALFDPAQPQYPNPLLMPQLIQVFYQENANQFPYMPYQETLGRFFNKTLSALVANCIAAVAVRYVS
jgi:hypothetical protein